MLKLHIYAVFRIPDMDISTDPNQNLLNLSSRLDNVSKSDAFHQQDSQAISSRFETLNSYLIPNLCLLQLPARF